MLKNEVNEKDDKLDKQVNIEVKKEGKVLFIQRLIAFLLDLFIVYLMTSLISTPFVNTKKIESLNDKSYEIMEKFTSNKITVNEYTAEYMNITYDLAKNSGLTSIISIIIGLVCYVVIPLYNNGQSIGKKILKIRIVSDNEELTVNQLILRAFIANSLLLEILSVVFIIFASRNNYFYCIGLFSMIQYLITTISVFMVMYGKKGLAVHDRIVHTQVVRS